MAIQKPTLEDVSNAYGLNLSYWKVSTWLNDRFDSEDGRYGLSPEEYLAGAAHGGVWLIEFNAEVKVCAWLYQNYKKPLNKH